MTIRLTPSDLDLLLDLGGNIDTARANLLLGLATDLCTSVVNPIPDNARAVVLSVAARAYMNAAGVQAQTVGPETVQYGTSFGGLYLTKVDITTLRRCAGSGGAFSFNPADTSAGSGLYPWDENIWLLGDQDNSFMPDVEPDGGAWE